MQLQIFNGLWRKLQDILRAVKVMASLSMSLHHPQVKWPTDLSFWMAQVFTDLGSKSVEAGTCHRYPPYLSLTAVFINMWNHWKWFLHATVATQGPDAQLSHQLILTSLPGPLLWRPQQVIPFLIVVYNVYNMISTFITWWLRKCHRHALMDQY